MLWALLIVPILVAAYVLVQRRRQKYVVRYASLSIVKDALGKGPGIRRHIPAALFLLGVATMITAMARPTATVMLPSNEGTVILTVDVSGSMRADDLKPSRIEAAKAAARAFVANQPKSVRIGVVSFSTNASIVQAPTTDRDAVLAAIDRLVPQRSTAIGSGILTSLDAIFEQSGATPTPYASDPLGAPLGASQTAPTPPPVPAGSYTSAIVVLLSDGASNIGPDPLDAAKVAADRGVKVYTVGVGNPNGVILRLGGQSARVRLDEETLKRIAQETNGDYFRADSESNLSDIYKKLSTQLVFKPQQTELTAGVTGIAAVFMLVAGGLSLLWFHRLP